MRHDVGKRLVMALWLAALLLLPTAATAQDERYDPSQLTIVATDTSRFPTITLQITAQDAQSNGIRDFSALTIREDDTPVESFTLETLPVGLDVTFVIDANTDINWVDLIGDVPRLAKVRTSIAQFASRYLSRAGLDRIHIVVPDGDAAQFLLAGGTTPAEVTEAIGGYAPTGLPTRAPLNALLVAALSGPPGQPDDDRYRALVVYTDAVDLAEQVDYDTLLPLAAARDVTVYFAIIGKRADADEVEAAARLYEPTGGTYIHMPQPEAADGLFQTLQTHVNHFLVSFRSRLNVSGRHTIALQLDDLAAQTALDVTVQPPEVVITLPPEPIFRLRDSAETPLEQIEPRRTIVSAQLSWPDGWPRQLTATRLLVDDVEQPSDRGAVLDVTGRLTLQWDISALEAGTYALEIEVVDELGLSSRSAPFSQTIITEITVTETPAPTPTPTATPTPMEATLAAVEPYLTRRNAQLALTGLIGLLLALAVWKVRGRRRRAAEAPAPVVTRNAVAGIPAAATVGLPEAALVVLENAPEYDGAIRLAGESITIGSAENEVDIVFRQPSVAGLHARLRFSHGVFLLYDEGSVSGTHVNRERLGLAPVILQDGDEITFGRVRVRLRLGPSTTTPGAT